MSLIDRVKNVVENPKNANKFGSTLITTTHTTGFPTFDYFNGKFGVDPATKKPVAYLGLNAGKPFMVAGPTSSGKSTLVYQMSYNIVKDYENGLIVVLDAEAAFSSERFVNITGCGQDWYDSHVISVSTGVYSETLMEWVIQLCQDKEEEGDALLVDHPNGIIDPKTGEVMKVMTPTVIIIDSVAVLRPKDFSADDDAKLNGQTAAGKHNNCQALQ